MFVNSPHIAVIFKYSCEKCAKIFYQKPHCTKELKCELKTVIIIDRQIEEKLIEINKKLFSSKL